MNKIELNDKVGRKILPTLEAINNNAFITPCFKIIIPALTTVSISNRIVVDGPGGLLDESILNMPIGILCIKLNAVGIETKLYKDDMRYRNAAMLSNFNSKVNFDITTDLSPTPLNKFFYETYITNLTTSPQQPSITILSSTLDNVSSPYDFVSGNLFTRIGTKIKFSASIQEAIINIQAYKAYSASVIIDDNDTHGQTKNIIINKINELNKTIWQPKCNTVPVL